MKKVMIMSNDDRLAAVLRRMLSDSGYTVATGTVEQCSPLTMPDEARVDLVVLDRQDAEQYGAHYLQAIKANVPHVPVIVLTHNYSLEKYLTARSLGAFDYLYTPFADQELIRVVEAAFGAGQHGEPAAASLGA